MFTLGHPAWALLVPSPGPQVLFQPVPRQAWGAAATSSGWQQARSGLERLGVVQRGYLAIGTP